MPTVTDRYLLLFKSTPTFDFVKSNQVYESTKLEFPFIGKRVLLRPKVNTK